MKKEDRFEEVYSQRLGVGSSLQVLVDKETHVQYLFVKEGYGGGLTPLLDSDGQPRLYREMPRLEEE